MPIRAQGCTELRCRKGPRSFRSPVKVWRAAISSGFLIASVIAGTPARADEFNPLVVYEEARVLNDQWQACAASFVRNSLRSPQTPERLAEQAFDRCRVRQGRLSRFLIGKIGRKSAGNVMTLLREKYRSDLIAAITQLRTRN